MDALSEVLRIISLDSAIAGGGPPARLICGFIACDPHSCQTFLGGLPPLIRVNIRDDPSGQGLENSLQFSVTEAARRQAGAGAVVAKLPIAYLTGWRLRLGARALEATSHSVVQIAAETGYESEAAFNRAFKRAHGMPPARYRKERAIQRSQA